MALQGDPCHAASLLAEIKKDLLEERTSAARIDYIAIAALVTAVILLVASIVGNSLTASAGLLWLACGAGALGALFSTGIAMRSRQILTDLQVRENRADAIVRICIGSIAGVLLVAMLMAEVVSFNFVPELPAKGKTEAGDAERSWLLYGLVAFVAGFSERLVSGLLERAGGNGAAATSNPLAGSTAAPAGATLAADEKNPLGLARDGDSAKSRASKQSREGEGAGEARGGQTVEQGGAAFEAPAEAANDAVEEIGEAQEEKVPA
jgi:hypothetical protein